MALYGRTRNTRLLVISLVLVSLAIITVDYRGGQGGPFEVAGRGVYTVVATMQSGVSKVLHPVGAFFSGLAHVGSLRTENQALKEKLREAQVQAGREASVERLNAELTKLVSLQGTLRLTGVTSRVTAESVGNFDWSVTIDKGSTAGVRMDDPVLVGDGLVGHVVEVTPNAAKVQMIIDPGSSVAARLSTSGETGLLIGQQDRDLRMDLVDPRAHVLPNEQVVTAGYQGGLYPAEIPIGVVSHIYQRPGELTKTISVRPAVNFTALEFVLVVTKR
jgi:rod shape-determining protein MreC